MCRSRRIVGSSSLFREHIIGDVIEFYGCKIGMIRRMCLKDSLDGEAKIGVILEKM